MCNRQKKGCRVARGEQQLFHAGHEFERLYIDIMGKWGDKNTEGEQIHIGYSGSIHRVNEF